jgi:predicted TIM-barrel fold metal-dependent hydrolase
MIDSDQHLYEPRTMWRDYIDPKMRDDALSLDDDELGYTWLTWRGERLQLADVHMPGNTAWCGDHRERLRAGEPASYNYDETLPDSYWDPAARLGWLDDAGLDAAVLFPNFGLLWERALSKSVRALKANMAAWNRWCATVHFEGDDRLNPVAHLTLRDPKWAEREIAAIANAGVRMAMIAPAPVNGRALSDPAHDRLWAAFVDHGVTPVFHVADQPRVLDDCWYTEPEAFVPVVESIFLWVPPALAITDLIINGVFDRHPDLHVGIVELSSVWVPMYLMMLDGGFDFTARLNGRPNVALEMRPSDYVYDHVRVSSFSYENPAKLMKQSGDIYMACSDYPHSEGSATPVADYERAGCDPEAMGDFFAANAEFLLRA